MSKEYKEHKEKKKPNKKAAYETFRRGKDEVAPVLDQCLGWLERNAIDAEGLFRVSGAVRDVEDLLKQFEKAQTSGKKVDLAKVKDPHVVAGVTKAWLRELSDPLLTYELYDCFVATAGVSDTEARVACVARIISYLPPGNRATLKRLCQFLRLVELNSARNRMNASNLAICFAPNVLRAKDQSPMSALHEMQAANTLLMTMITYFDVIFLKKEFPKAQEALTKMPEKEKNDIERKFRTGTVRLALAETEDLFDDESDDSTPVMAAPPPRSHHKPLSEVMFEQPAQPATPEPPPKGDKPLTSPRERAQALPHPAQPPPHAAPAHAPHASSYTPAQAQAQAVAEEAKKVDTLKRERRDNVEAGKNPAAGPAAAAAAVAAVAAAAPEPPAKAGSHTDVKETRSLSSGAQLAPVAEDKTEAPHAAVPAAGPKGLIGGVRMVGAGMDLAAVKLKPRPAADPSAAAHLPPPIVAKPTASTRAPAPATKGLPPPMTALDKRKSSEAVKPTPLADPELPPLPAEPLPQPTRTPSNPAITDDLPPIPDEPLPLPPGPPTANTHLNPNPNPNPNPSPATNTPLSPRGKLPAPITTSPAAPKSKLPSVRRAPPPVPLNMPVNNPPAQHTAAAAAPTDVPKPLVSPKTAAAKPPPPLVSPRALPAVAPQPRDLPPPPMLVPPSLMHDKDKDKEREKKEAQEKEKEPSRDVPLEKLAEWLLEGRKDDVALYLATLPEAEAKERRVAVKSLLAKKLAELDTLG